MRRKTGRVGINLIIRYEKRWMEKENKKLKKELFKKERIRINRLVNLSQTHDPRIIEWKRKEEEIKQKRKDEIKRKKEEKRRKEEERIRQREEKRRQEEEEKLKRKKEKEEAKKKKKEQDEEVKEKFKRVFLENIKEDKMDKYFVNEIIRKLKIEELDMFADKLTNRDITSGKQVKMELKRIADERKKVNKQMISNKKKEKKISSEMMANKWTEEEMRLLHKGVNKYPAGTHNRWTRIATFIGGRFSENEVVEIARKLKNVSMKGKANSKIKLFTVNQKKTVSKNLCKK